MTSIFNRWFSKKGQKKSSDAPARDLAALTAPLRSPAIHIVKTDKPACSHFGGSPILPLGSTWPVWNGKKLAFLSQLSLSEIHAALRIDWLPDSGALLFFYDMERQPWGFDPKDRGCSAVLFCPEPSSPASLQQFLLPEISAGIPRRYVSFRRIDVLPSWERESIHALGLSEEEYEQIDQLQHGIFQNEPKHQISGFPACVQGDSMELECQLASNGLYLGDPTGYEDVRAHALKPGASNWRLLLQIDSDDELGMMWGDAGAIYIWVEEQAARRGDFQNAWLILQCG